MDFGLMMKRAEKLLVDNSPAIMTAIAVTGTVATAYLTGKASFKAAALIQDEYDRRIVEAGSANRVESFPDFREKAELTWKLYIPAASTAVLTIACIITSNRVGNRRAAAMAAAYSFSEKAYRDYREKVVEKLGGKKEEALRDELAQERISNNPPSSQEIIIAGGDVLCRDEFSGRYFMSTVQTIKAAQNDVNHQINNSYYASVTDFYDKIGLPKTSVSDEMGWNSDRLLELRFSTTMSDDNRPCISIGFDTVPIRGYHRVQ